jgi:hypothetical protein
VAYQLLLPLQQQLAAHGFSMSTLGPLLLQQLPHPTADSTTTNLIPAVLGRPLFAVRPECVSLAATGAAQAAKHAAAAAAGHLLPHFPQQLAASAVQGLVTAQQQLQQIAQAQQQELPAWLGHLEDLQETCAPAQQQQQQQQQQEMQQTVQQQLQVIPQAQQQELPGRLGHLEGLQESYVPTQQQQQQQRQQRQRQQTVQQQQQQKPTQGQQEVQQLEQQPGQDSALYDTMCTGQQAPHLQQQCMQQNNHSAAVACRKRHLQDTDAAVGAAVYDSSV